MGPEASLPPASYLRQLAFMKNISRALYAAADLGLADILASGPAASGEVAARAGADGAAVRRLLRILVAFGVFEEPTPDRFQLNSTGELLRRDATGSLRAGLLLTAGQMRWRLWSDFLECVRTGRAAIDSTFGKNLFERHAENDEESATFHNAMAAYSAAESGPLIEAYDFSRFSRIADVGGGTGRFLAHILAATPKSLGTLLDLPNVLRAAPSLLEESGVADRCELVSGSFFDDVPSGADAYVLKSVLHDWDDERATAILANCRKAMAPTAVLVIAERVMPEKAEEGRAMEAYLLDLEMLVNTPGGRERSESEFRTILGAAGLRLTHVVSTPVPMKLVEARPV